MNIDFGEKKSEFLKDLNLLTNSIITIGYDAANNASYGANYKFATISAILKVVKPLFQKFNFSMVQPLAQKETGLHLVTMLIHNTGGSITSIVKIEAIDSTGKSGRKSLSTPQELGVSITYMRRYALASMLSIATDEDTDATIIEAPQNRQTPKTPQRPFKQEKKEAPKSTLDPKKGHKSFEKEVIDEMKNNDMQVIKKDDVLTEAQRKKMYALMASTNTKADVLKKKIKDDFNKDSSKYLTKSEANKIIEFLEKRAV